MYQNLEKLKQYIKSIIKIYTDSGIIAPVFQVSVLTYNLKQW